MPEPLENFGVQQTVDLSALLTYMFPARKTTHIPPTQDQIRGGAMTAQK